jgi:hypothetical protein
MKKIILTGVGIFLAALLTGYAIASLPNHLPPFPTRLPISKNTDQNNQQKILLILVDDHKSSQPVVESIWMVYVYPDQQPYWQFLPVYSLRDLKDNPELQSAYQYGLFGFIQGKFWKTLNSKYGLEWDQYLILDNAGLSAFHKEITGKDPPKTLGQPVNLEKPADFLAMTSKLIKSYCGIIKSGNKNPIPPIDWTSIYANLKSGMKMKALASNWELFIENPQKNPCNIIKTN